DALNGTNIPVFDSRQATENVDVCYLILDQNNQREDETKCNIASIQNLTIEVIERVPRSGKAGSRVALDDAPESLFFAFDNITLTNYNITNKSITGLSDTRKLKWRIMQHL
ncbi:MAG: hypothetical protein R6U97_05755, partial [Desulfosalsimonas sp.]